MKKKITNEEIRKATDIVFNTPRPDPERKVKLTFFTQEAYESFVKIVDQSIKEELEKALKEEYERE